MYPIQIVLIVALVFSIILLFLIPQKRILGRIFFLMQFLVGLIFVLFPDLSSKAGEILGVGRGTDLILYFLVVIFYISVLLFMGKLRQIERRQTEILRELTLLKQAQEDTHDEN